MTSVVGHVFNLDFAPEYQNWEKTDCVDLFAAKTIHKEASGGVIRHLRDVGKNVFVLFTAVGDSVATTLFSGWIAIARVRTFALKCCRA